MRNLDGKAIWSAELLCVELNVRYFQRGPNQTEGKALESISNLPKQTVVISIYKKLLLKFTDLDYRIITHAESEKKKSILRNSLPRI